MSQGGCCPCSEGVQHTASGKARRRLLCHTPRSGAGDTHLACRCPCVRIHSQHWPLLPLRPAAWVGLPREGPCPAQPAQRRARPRAQNVFKGRQRTAAKAEEEGKRCKKRPCRQQGQTRSCGMQVLGQTGPWKDPAAGRFILQDGRPWNNPLRSKNYQRRAVPSPRSVPD